MKKTSKEWSEHFGCVVLDPDGWDRKNYEFSYYLEEISESEFRDRCAKSTMLTRGDL